MRIIFVDVPISLKYFVYIISKIFKETYFFNMKNIASSEFLFKKKIKPINFEDNNYNSIEKYIFGINSGLENHLKSFFFLDLEKTLKNYFRDTYNKKAIYSSLQQFIIPLSDYTGKLKIWIESKKPKKNLVIYFHSKFYFSPSISKNTYTIIIPLNLFFFISFKKLFLKKKFLRIKNQKTKKKKYFRPILYLVNQSIFYGPKNYRLFKKDTILDKTSVLKKYVDIFYINIPNQENIPLKQKVKLFFESLKIFFPLLFKFRNFKNYLTIFFFIKLIFLKKKFYNLFKEKNYKCCYNDYDILLPSYIYWALKMLNIKIFSYQERFNLGFKTNRITVFCDQYFINNPSQVKHLSKSPFVMAKTFKIVGQIKSEFMKKYQRKSKLNKQKTIVIFGYNVPNNQYRAYHEPLTNWKAQKIFLNDFINISSHFKNYKFIMRFKSLEWLKKNIYFKDELEKIKKIKNLEISNNYSYLEAYKICSKSHLIIGKWSSIIDEASCAGKPIIIYNYTGNSKNNVKKYFDYGSNINCNNLNELKILIREKINRNFCKEDKIFSKKYYGNINKLEDYTKKRIRRELLEFIK